MTHPKDRIGPDLGKQLLCIWEGYAFEIPPLVLLVHAALESATATEGYSQLAATPPVLRHNCTEVATSGRGLKK